MGVEMALSRAVADPDFPRGEMATRGMLRVWWGQEVVGVKSVVGSRGGAGLEVVGV